jgi:hypothetical protein
MGMRKLKAAIELVCKITNTRNGDGTPIELFINAIPLNSYDVSIGFDDQKAVPVDIAETKL